MLFHRIGHTKAANAHLAEKADFPGQKHQGGRHAK
jgi:hypothetical protein